MVYTTVFWCNLFVLKGGLSITQSPYEIIFNRKMNCNACYKVEFTEHVQTHEEHGNTIQWRTIRTIATRPNNDGGGYYFISLSTGHLTSHHSLIPMTMPAEVVAQVHHLAWQTKANKTCTFTTTHDKDIVVPYIAITQDEDDVDPVHVHDELSEVDGGDKDDADKTKYYDPEQDDGEDSEDKEDDVSNNDNDNRDDAPETEMIDGGVNVNEKTEDDK